MSELRYDELRRLVATFFKASLDDYNDLVDRRGPLRRFSEIWGEEAEIHSFALDSGITEISDDYLEDHVPAFSAFASLSEATVKTHHEQILDEMRKGRRDLIRAVLERMERLNTYEADYRDNAVHEIATPPLVESPSLGGAIEDFLKENASNWTAKTLAQNKAYLSILLEYFGDSHPVASITKQDASEVKKLVLALPANRNTIPKLKAMTLQQLTMEPGLKKISTRTINSHIQMFKMFFDWTEAHGYTPTTHFERMKVKQIKGGETGRMAFTPEQSLRVYTELTQNTSGLVRKESHKWGMVLGMFTGARLNEICQLELDDLKREGELFYLHITDEGDEKKRVKTKAGRRKVPLHSELLKLGFLDFVETRKPGTRLFPDYSYSPNGGYGRNLGRWCNESFLPKLGIKDRDRVFHSFRHTLVTRLHQADVADPVVKSIVGHARQGVTQAVYNKEGYTLQQLKDAIDRFKVLPHEEL